MLRDFRPVSPDKVDEAVRKLPITHLIRCQAGF